MTDDAYNAMIRARAEVRRALRAIASLLDHNLGGHTIDRAEASRSCLDALEVALNVEIDDFEYSRDPKAFARKIKRR